ncbi:G patch domain and ankyrin repeat-containing protein 1 [Sardina pilchardus]|uniref:G patch domain and ankyrin repeat-containing protein 1 n=1 Tax=Sardina pilchardus TaxID=27697 RepID=UPI002E13711D
MSASVFFTPAQEDDQIWIDGRLRTGGEEDRSASALTGDEARDFYRSLLAEKEQGQEARGEPSGKRGKTTKGSREQRRRAGPHHRRGEERRGGGGRAAAAGGGSGTRGGGGGGGGGGGDEGGRRGAQPPQGSSSGDKDGHRLLRVAQEGDLAALRKLLKGPRPRADVNFHDGFYWTAVMCASHAGRAEAVTLLLEHGASWVGMVDTQGRDARDLAERAGHDDVVRVLDRHGAAGAAGSGNGERSAGASIQQPPQWCSVCESLYSGSEAQHQSSTLHQFNRGRLSQPAAPHYCLPPTNAGYRMMLRSGWNPGAGLGPEGQGPKQPVRTILKRDQAGLGYGPTPRPKVTHFQAKDAHAVERPTKSTERREKGTTLNAKALKRREDRQRTWERDFRTSFNYDL